MINMKKDQTFDISYEYITVSTFPLFPRNTLATYHGDEIPFLKGEAIHKISISKEKKNLSSHDFKDIIFIVIGT